METQETIRKRCSLKAHISGREIEPEKINMVLEAGRLAASSAQLPALALHRGAGQADGAGAYPGFL